MSSPAHAIFMLLRHQAEIYYVEIQHDIVRSTVRLLLPSGLRSFSFARIKISFGGTREISFRHTVSSFVNDVGVLKRCKSVQRSCVAYRDAPSVARIGWVLLPPPLPSPQLCFRCPAMILMLHYMLMTDPGTNLLFITICSTRALIGLLSMTSNMLISA